MICTLTVFLISPTENVRSKRLRSSNIAKENPASTVTTEESMDKDPFMYMDEDIYDASPPPATSSAVRRSSPTPQRTSSASVATIGASRTEPVRETPGLQRQANGNSKSPLVQTRMAVSDPKTSSSPKSVR